MTASSFRCILARRVNGLTRGEKKKNTTYFFRHCCLEVINMMSISYRWLKEIHLEHRFLFCIHSYSFVYIFFVLF